MASKRCYAIIIISHYLNFKRLHCDSQVINDFFCGSKVSQMQTFLFSELKPAENKHLSCKYNPDQLIYLYAPVAIKLQDPRKTKSLKILL